MRIYEFCCENALSLGFSRLLILVICLFLLLLANNNYVNAQENDKSVEIINKIPKHIPLKIELENIVKENTIRELNIKVTNTSERPIYQLMLFLKALDVTILNKRGYSFSHVYGTNRGVPIGTPAQDDDIRLEPGESVMFQVNKKYAEMFKRILEKLDEPYPKRFQIVFHYLTFADGTGFLDTSGSPFPSKWKQ